MKPDLSVKVWGKTFKNPIVVASATPTKDAKYMLKGMEAGAGGVISKTVTFEPLLQKYVSPRFTVLHKKGWPHVYSNYSCEFLATYTPKEWLNELRQARKYADEYNSVLIGSISGSNMENWAELAKMVEDTGVDMLELNFGCPHPQDLGYKSGAELGGDPEAGAKVTDVVVNAVDVPVIVKVTAEGVNPIVVSKAVKEAGARGLTVVNRFPALEIDLDTGRPLLHSGFAGVGGPWMRPITLKWIAKIAKQVGLPISATNGIATWKDVAKCIMVGAYTVQTCTALMYGKKGYAHISDFLQGLSKFMEEKGYKNLDEIRGITLPQIKTWDTVDRETLNVSKVDTEKCIGCKICRHWCLYGAISYKPDTGGKEKAYIDPELCDGCGLCPSLCPQGAIVMEGPDVYLGDFD